MSLLLHLPRATRYIPLAERGGLAVEDDEIERQHLALVDDRADELFAPISDSVWTLQAKVSPLVVDVGRKRDDAEEPAAELGLGAVHTRGVRNVLLRPSLEAARREKLLVDWYDPHHAELNRLVKRMRDAGYSRCVLIDAGSYPDDPLPRSSPPRGDPRSASAPTPSGAAASSAWHASTSSARATPWRRTNPSAALASPASSARTRSAT